MHGVGCADVHLHWARTGGYGPGHLDLGCVEASSTPTTVPICIEIPASRIFALLGGQDILYDIR